MEKTNCMNCGITLTFVRSNVPEPVFNYRSNELLIIVLDLNSLIPLEINWI